VHSSPNSRPPFFYHCPGLDASTPPRGHGIRYHPSGIPLARTASSLTPIFVLQTTYFFFRYVRDFNAAGGSNESPSCCHPSLSPTVAPPPARTATIPFSLDRKYLGRPTPIVISPVPSARVLSSFSMLPPFYIVFPPCDEFLLPATLGVAFLHGGVES